MSKDEISSEYLEKAWRDLDKRATTSAAWAAVRLPASPVERELLLAIDENKRRHLLVPAGPGRYAVNTHSPLSVDVTDLKFNFEEGTKVEGRYVDVSCKVPKLNDQFDDVIESVLDSVIYAADPAKRAITMVNSWRRLFSTMASAKPLSLNEKYAIFAELAILDQIELQRESFSEEWWTGPQFEEHDFELPNVSIEVKAIGISSKTISIHGVDQLSRTDGKPLYLVVVALEESGVGQTVASLLESIAARSPDGDKIRFKAASLGVFPDVEDTTKLRVTKVGIAAVDEEFPQLTVSHFSESLREALGGVQYELLLTALQPRLKFIELSGLMKEIED